MGQSAGAINVYALLTSPLMVSANPKLFHKLVPLSGGISLATNLPAGSIPTLSPASTYLAQGNALLYNQLIADGKATDTASAQAYVATQTPAQIAAYMRGKDPAALLSTLLTKLAALGLSGSGPIPEGTVVPVDPIAAINAGNYVKVPVLAGNARDEAKLFPTFLALSPALGGVSGRLVSDATLFNTQFGYNPDGPPTVTLAQWIPAVYLPVTTPVTGFNARTDLLNLVFFTASRDNVLNALKSQQTDRLVLPVRLGQGAGALERHLRRRPRLRPAVHLRHLRPVALRQHHDRHREQGRPARSFGRDDEEHRRVRAEQRPEQRRRSASPGRSGPASCSSTRA